MLKKGLYLVVCVLALSACGSKDNGNGGGGAPAPGGQVATTALDASCLNGLATPNQACNGALYGQSNQYGFMPYQIQQNTWQGTGYYSYSYQQFNPQQWGGISNQAAFCSCPRGYRPVYTNTQGLGCVSIAHLNRNYGAAVYFAMDSNNQFVLAGLYHPNFQSDRYDQHPSGLRRMSRVRMYNFRNRNTCYQHVIQGCQVGVTPCAAGSSCIPAGVGSPIGICATGAAGVYGYSSTGHVSGGGSR